MTSRGSIRWFGFAALLAASGCFNFDKALRDCRDDGGAWLCGSGDGGAGGGAGGGTGGGAGGGSGGGSGGGTGGGSTGFAGDGGCPGLVREGWCWENPIPGGINLHDVTGTSDNDVYFAGSSGTLLRFDGTLFHDVAVPWVETGIVRSLSMLPDGGAWAGGDGINGLYRRTATGWVGSSQVANAVRQIVALANGDVLAATETGIVSSDNTWFPPVDGDSRGCSGVVVAPELGDGGFLAACGYSDAGAPGPTRQVVRSDGTIEVRETQMDGGDPTLAFNRMWQDGAGRRFVAGSSTTANYSFGSTHLRTDAGGWSPHWVLNNGSSGIDFVAGAGFGTQGSHLVVGQGTRFARFDGTATSPATSPDQLPAGSDGYAHAAWVSPQGTMWICGDNGYAGAGDPALIPAGWRVVRSGPSFVFYGAEVVGSQLLAVGGPSTQSWYFPTRVPGPALPSHKWRGVWLSPQNTLWFAAESGAIVRAGQTVTGEAGNYKDVWGLSDDEVFFPNGQGLRRWLNGALDSPVGTGDLWKVHGDPSSGEVWAVGLGATIFRRANRDAGFVQMPAPAGFTEDLFAVRLLAPGRVAISGNGGKIFESEPDGGWFEMEPNPVSGSAFYDIYPATDGGYYAVGGDQVVVRVRNRIFQLIPIPATSQLERVRPMNGRLYVVGGNGQVLSQPEQ